MQVAQVADPVVKVARANGDKAHLHQLSRLNFLRHMHELRLLCLDDHVGAAGRTLTRLIRVFLVSSRCNSDQKFAVFDFDVFKKL